MNKAAFSLKEYKFEKVSIDFSKRTSNELNITFDPSGKFISENSTFELTIVFNAFNEDVENSFVTIKCSSTFQFENEINFNEMPSYFYRNSIAIVFPYIRAFISTVTLQANIPPIILPTMNLTSLEIPLKQNTTNV